MVSYFNHVFLCMWSGVLILIVVDNGLVQNQDDWQDEGGVCLNPYCSGQWSRTDYENFSQQRWHCVLILIVVDNGLVLDLIRHY